MATVESSIKESPKKIDVSMLIADNEKSNNEINLEQLPEMALFQKVINPRRACARGLQ